MTIEANDFGVLIEPATLRMQRVLPGPIERIWSYLTQSELRRQWMAAGEMDLETGAPFEFVWRNDELSEAPSGRGPDNPIERRMTSRVVRAQAPQTLIITWGANGEVQIDLEPKGDEVLLTLTHRRVPEEDLPKVAPGWHMHLDVLVARARGAAAPPFWTGWRALQEIYAGRFQH